MLELEELQARRSLQRQMQHLIESTITVNDLGMAAKLGAEVHGMEVFMKASLELTVCLFGRLVTRLGT